jgi:hypothetical protein
MVSDVSTEKPSIVGLKPLWKVVRKDYLSIVGPNSELTRATRYKQPKDCGFLVKKK